MYSNLEGHVRNLSVANHNKTQQIMKHVHIYFQVLHSNNFEENTICL